MCHTWVTSDAHSSGEAIAFHRYLFIVYFTTNSHFTGFIYFLFTLLKINIVSFQGSQGGQTEKQCFRNKNLTRETSNVSELDRKHSCFPGSKICFCNNVSTGGKTFKETLRITNVSATMFPSLPRA
jgi:hypothetical protein